MSLLKPKWIVRGGPWSHGRNEKGELNFGIYNAETGEPLKGVHRAIITAEPNDIVRLQVELIGCVLEVTTSSEYEIYQPSFWSLQCWKRALLKLKRFLFY